MASKKQHSPDIERALARQNAGFAVSDEADLQDLVFIARCAADRLVPVAQQARDILAALDLALRTGNDASLAALARPALQQIASAHVAAVQQFGDGAWPVGFDSSAPHLRVHGSKAGIGELLLEIASIYPRKNARNEPGREVAEHYADFVSLGAGLAPFESSNPAAARAKLFELCPEGPSDDLETDAVRIGEALGMAQKDARNAVDAAAAKRDRKSSAV